jgi:photosystem II stability/assembly factor-like uncharacterized protein
LDSLWIATGAGLALAERSASGWQVVRRDLPGEQVTSIIAREGVVLAGTTRGVFRSDDLGRTWRSASSGLTVPHVRWLAYDPQVSDLEYAGNEPAAIFFSRNGGELWQACPEVSAMRDEFGWSLPYSPEAGCVRGLAFHGSRAYAAVEDGAVLVSQDAGETWSLAAGSRGPAEHWPAEGRVHSDVHSIEVHPSSPDMVFAPTGGGLYRSEDGGKSWQLLYRCYCRAIWLDPQDGTHLIFGQADGVDRNGRILETRDAGQTWHNAAAGLDTPWSRTMVERFFAAGGELFAVLSDGRLYVTALADLHWQPLLAELPGVRVITTMF